MVSELNLFKYINYDSCEITLLMELVHNMEFLKFIFKKYEEMKVNKIHIK
jgi:hypothetical protein